MHKQNYKIKNKNLGVLWNLHNFLIDMAKTLKKNPKELDKNLILNMISYEEKYILSKTNSTIKKVTTLLDSYRLDEAIDPIEELYLELSRTYIQLVREKAATGDTSEQEVVL